MRAPLLSLLIAAVAFGAGSLGCSSERPAPGAGSDPTGPVVVSPPGQGSSGGPDAAADAGGDAGDAGEEQEPACPPDGSCNCTHGTCEPGCLDGECAFECAAGTTCRPSCTGGGCTFVCRSGSTCDPTCPGGGCTFVCEDGAECNNSCYGGACTFDCAPGALCNNSCIPGNCE